MVAVRRALVLVALLLMPVLLVPATPAAAQNDDLRWAVIPSGPQGPNGRGAFEYEAKPGDVIADTVGVSNLTDQPITFTVYSTDAFTSADGAFSLFPAATPPKDLGTWTDLTPKSYTVQPKTRADIAFKLTVPLNATPGDHAGGIIASVVEQQTTAQGQQVNVDRRIAARIYLRVAGPVTPTVQVESLTVGYEAPALPFGTGDLVVTYRVKNAGNVRVHGTARVRATGPLGVGLGDAAEVTVPELLPGAEFTVQKRIPGVRSLGRLTASVTVNAEAKEGRLPVASRSASVWASPWGLAGLVVLLAGAAALVVRWRLRRRSAGLR
ncbi:hypothetical protein GCM10010399_74420 [Dactylosporangium fulvum]|uniref:DUF916 domain-containing protein n=1 Tax=Dactylosporangium fulvum TaxID=53359 RepID=A0ABY5VRM5_9ACTN|nr:DUF916 domain-containing protein [Dactylosporangium fulvum]UWP79138.1 DUF916 domain-containing protein [Dactylosporangium fulvum]